MQDCQWYRVKRTKTYFANKGNCGKRFRHLFINSGSSHFFNKIIFEPLSLYSKYGFISILKIRFFFSTNQQFVSDLEVINDGVGRSVKFGGDYNEILTTKEQQRQSILQIV